MRGDIIPVGNEHRAAAVIVDRLIDDIRANDRRFTIAIAGGSGSGASGMGRALADELGERDVEFLQ